MTRRPRRRYRPRPLLRWAKPTFGWAPDNLHIRLAGMINASHPLAMPLALRTAAADIGGMRLVALRTGLNRESLYRALAPDGNPTLRTLDRVLAVFGLRLTVASIAGTRAIPHWATRDERPTTRREADVHPGTFPTSSSDGSATRARDRRRGHVPHNE